jgi:hypothetical protein
MGGKNSKKRENFYFRAGARGVMRADLTRVPGRVFGHPNL